LSNAAHSVWHGLGGGHWRGLPQFFDDMFGVFNNDGNFNFVLHDFHEDIPSFAAVYFREYCIIFTFGMMLVSKKMLF
jgi:hypothetical protein